jgi:hypothetical protein
MYYTGIVLLFSFIIGFFIGFFMKKKQKYIYITDYKDITKYKFIDTKNKCYSYKVKEIKC